MANLSAHNRPRLTVVGEEDFTPSNENDLGHQRPPPPPPSDPNAPLRKFLAKRTNEWIKHFNSVLNTLSGGVLLAGVLVPFIQKPETVVTADTVQWCVIGLGFHILGHMITYLFWQSEE